MGKGWVPTLRGPFDSRLDLNLQTNPILLTVKLFCAVHLNYCCFVLIFLS